MIDDMHTDSSYENNNDADKESVGGPWHRNASFKTLTETLRKIDRTSGSNKKWSDAAASATRAAVGSFLLTRDDVSVTQVETTWKDAFDMIINAYGMSSVPEAALLAENFPGFVLWRTTVSWDRLSWSKEKNRLEKIITDMTGSHVINNLTRNTLRTNAAFGPVVMRDILLSWLTEFEEAATTAFAYCPAKIMDEIDKAYEMQNFDETWVPSPDPTTLSTRLIKQQYSAIYDFPMVQEGIRLVTAACNWVVQFIVIYCRTRDTSYRPLTRALFTICFVDQYFWKSEIDRPEIVASRFIADTDALGAEALLGPAQANMTKRTAYEVRVSSAIAYGDPFVKEVRPGVASARVRTDVAVLLPNGPLDKDALNIHVAAVLRILAPPVTYNNERIGSEMNNNDQVSLQDAKRLIADSAQTALAAAGKAKSFRQLLESLVHFGFVPTACRAYDAALKAEFTKRRYQGSVNSEQNKITDDAIFDEAQQAVGCISALGISVYGLAETYGPGLDYLDSFIYIAGQNDMEWDEYYSALGYSGGALVSVLSKTMPPEIHIDYLQSLRGILLLEIEASENHSMDGLTGRMSSGSSAKESLLMWFDRRTHERWGVSPQKHELDNLPYGNDINDSNKVDDMSRIRFTHETSQASVDATMLSVAVNARYPKPAPNLAEVKTQAFGKYAAASVGVDALMSLAAAAFTAPHISSAVDVMTWARDFGGSSSGSFCDHRTKINALIYTILPFSGQNPQIPGMDDASNIESLLGELYDAVSKAVASLPKEARPYIPAKPTIANSAFLFSMYATVIRLTLQDLAERTREITESVTTLIWSLADSAGVLRDFFCAEFSAEGNTSNVVTISVSDSTGDKEIIGAWDITDLIAAVGDAYGDCADATAGARVSSVSLRALVQDTVAATTICGNTLERIRMHVESSCGTAKSNASQSDNAALCVFSSFLQDHVELQKIQNEIGMHLRKITAGGTTIPGLQSVESFLGAVSNLNSAMERAVENPSDNFAAAVKITADVLAESNALQEKPQCKRQNAELSEVVRSISDMTDGYDEKHPSELGNVTELTEKYNIKSIKELNVTPLKYNAIPKGGLDAGAHCSDELLLRRIITRAEILKIVDSVFNPEVRTSGKGNIQNYSDVLSE